jgi:hypothetical protein
MNYIVRLLSCFSFIFLINGFIYSATNDFLPAVSISTLSSPRGVAVGNVFGNGIQSLIVANFGSPTFIGQSTPATLLTLPNSALQIFSPSPDGLKLIETVPTASSPRGNFVFDPDNKGRGDIFVTAYDANLLQVFSWEKGQFIKTNEEATLKMPVGVTAGLTSSSGTPFVAVANYGSSSLSLFQVKDGKLGKRIDIPVAEGPTQVAIGDLNGDGMNEIAVVCLPSHQIEILSKTPGGKGDDLASYSVTKSFVLPEGSAPADLRIADLNNDGRSDLVAADFSKNAVLIYLQQKDGSLTAENPLPTSGSHPNGLTVADLNGDGKKEIIVANRDSDSIDIFQSVGSQFQLVKTLKVANDSDSTFGPVEIGVLDTNGKGGLDLVSSHMRSNTIKVLTQTLLTFPTSTATPYLEGGVGSPFSEKTTYCFPNPSHDGKVKFSFTLNSPSEVNIQVFDLTGEAVWGERLNPSQTQNGVNTLTWDGVNQNGGSLASGMYLYRISVKDYTVTKKVAIIH